MNKEDKIICKVLEIETDDLDKVFDPLRVIPKYREVAKRIREGVIKDGKKEN